VPVLQPSQLKSRDVERFLGKVFKHPLLGKRFKNSDSIRKKYLANQIRTVLNYAFKYDRVYPWRELFKIHRGMAITKLEMTTFNELFLKVCFHKKLPQFSVERRVMTRIGNLILDNKSMCVGAGDVLFMYRAIQKNPIVCHKFKEVTPCQVDRILEQLMFIMMGGGSNKEFEQLARSHWDLNITGAEYDEFSKLYLQMHHSEVEFVEKSKPIFKKLRSYMVMDKAETSQLYHEMKTSFFMGKHFQLLQFENLRHMVRIILHFVEDPDYIAINMDKHVDHHKKLGLNAEEIDEFGRLFLENAKNKEMKFVFKFKQILSDFKEGLLGPIVT